MQYFDWDPEKNKKLIKERGVSFEICLVYIEQGKILDIIKNKDPYQHQFVYVIEIDEYVYYIPFVEDKERIFLKTIIPSRKATKKYLKQ